ncbi:DUF3054 domain-containing protein [Haloarcula salinisoli]|uniref:DUF3054 domain-containing protein n=1 Tax=Haloarcula salinisoli TaxID=2487746 RepID=A0A8J7YGB7_9EURY|nr:DUF3054 domain-containing protein [Halomicroarcula salinisoli]MBX0302806.1 DUF3054 domain-containing protein [Halomicroarcula salinisoli]
MSVATADRSRIDLSQKTALLAAGDLAAILAFIVLGSSSHSYGPFDVVHIAGAFAPFLVGWLLVAGPAGLYASDAPGTLANSTLVTLLVWIVAVAIAQALRATGLFPGGAALTFAVVSVLVGGLLLTLWRIVATVTLAR